MLKNQKKITVFKIQGIDCPSCATMIECDMQDAGIKCKCDYATQTLTVENIDDNKLENIKKIIGSLGYIIVD